MSSICFTEPTIDELLADSLTQGLMSADRVDVSALKTMFRNVASAIESRPSIQHDRYIRPGSNWAQAPVGGRLPSVPSAGISAACDSYGAMAGCPAC
jgi:hypothetical protein